MSAINDDGIGLPTVNIPPKKNPAGPQEGVAKIVVQHALEKIVIDSSVRERERERASGQPH